MEAVALYWLIFGLVLMVMEAVVPGLVVSFLGIAAIFVSLLIHLDWLNDFSSILLTWMITSLVLLFTIRLWVRRFLPANTSVGNMDEDKDAIGTEVQVTRKVSTLDESGRIFFRGTTWPARCLENTIDSDQNCVLVRRENTAWIVDAVTNSKG